MSRTISSTVALLALFVFALAFSVSIGPIRIGFAELARIATGGTADAMHRTIVLDVRLPRTLLAAAIGGALSAAGAAYQGLFRNTLADPYVVGASSGAALGATLAIVVGLDAFGLGVVSIAAFAGAMATVCVVYLIAAIGGLDSPVSLLLAGVAVSSVIAAIVTLLMILNSQDLVTAFVWVTGGLNNRSWTHLAGSCPWMFLGIVVLWLLSRPLDALAFGEESAQSLGLALGRTRLLVVAAASLATAGAVAAAGVIGFVGLVAPHAARLLIGARHARLIPASMLAGATLLVLADVLARQVAQPIEVPVGVITAILGGPFFLILLAVRQRELTHP